MNAPRPASRRIRLLKNMRQFVSEQSTSFFRLRCESAGGKGNMPTVGERVCVECFGGAMRLAIVVYPHLAEILPEATNEEVTAGCIKRPARCAQGFSHDWRNWSISIGRPLAGFEPKLFLFLVHRAFAL